MVMGTFFCIRLERPKYFYIAVDKATYLQMNSVLSFPTGKTVPCLCPCVFWGLETGFSWGWPFTGAQRGRRGSVYPAKGIWGKGGPSLESASCMSRGKPWENLVLKEHMLCLLHICHLCLFLGYGFAYSGG